jgi:hypothetical protein
MLTVLILLVSAPTIACLVDRHYQRLAYETVSAYYR